MTSRGPRSAEARARRDRGKPPVDRRLPRHLECSTHSLVPDRLLRDDSLSPSARLIGAAIAGKAGPKGTYSDATNSILGLSAGVAERSVPDCLAELEAAGFVHRLYSWDRFGLSDLEIVGFAPPWEAKGEPRPQRALVLLWRLPEPQYREGRRFDTPRGVEFQTPERQKGGGS